MSQAVTPVTTTVKPRSASLILARICNGLLGALLILFALAAARVAIGRSVQMPPLILGVDLATTAGILGAGLCLIVCALGMNWNHPSRALLSLTIAILAPAVAMHLAADQAGNDRLDGTLAEQMRIHAALAFGAGVPLIFAPLIFFDARFILQNFDFLNGPHTHHTSVARRIVRIAAPVIGILGLAITAWTSSGIIRDNFHRFSDLPFRYVVQWFFPIPVYIALMLTGIWGRTKTAVAVAAALAMILIADFAGSLLVMVSRGYARVALVGSNQLVDRSAWFRSDLRNYLASGPALAQLAVQVLLIALAQLAWIVLSGGQPPARRQATLRLAARGLFFWNGIASLMVGGLLVGTALIATQATPYYMTAVVPASHLTGMEVAGGVLILLGAAALFAIAFQRPAGVPYISLALAGLQLIALLAVTLALTFGFLILADRSGVYLSPQRTLCWTMLLLQTSAAQLWFLMRQR